MKIAIIGAGMAGLSCATKLLNSGHEVAAFDKGRGPGGRMSTRRITLDTDQLSFDHGAQYFTTRNADFAAQVAIWAGQGVVAQWPAAGSQAWVGTPGMNAPIKAMAKDLTVNWGARVESIDLTPEGWMIRNVSSLEAYPFDAVVVAVPAEQAVPLLEVHDQEAASLARATPSAPSWTVIVRFAQPSRHLGDVLRNVGIIAWAARDSAKPCRDGGDNWVLQATAEWSQEHINDPPESVQIALLAAFAEQTNGALPQLIHLSSHRWLYAKSGCAGVPMIWNAKRALGVCGDWFLGARVECAWVSGTALANEINAQPPEPA